MSRHRAWCFTINNKSGITEEDRCTVKQIFKLAQYAVVGDEVGEKGTPHLQGYIHMKTPLSLIKMKWYLPRANLRVACGNDKHNQDYCSKEHKNVIEVGEPGLGQGSRTDLHELTDKIRNKEITNIDDIMFDYPMLYCKYYKSLEKMLSAMQPKREAPPKIFWRWGLSGTGKTRYCIDTHKSHYIKDGTPWWDNYQNQEAVIIDDFDNNIPFRTLLRILDRYTYQGQIKGGYVNINSPYIYITCEYPPNHFWEGNELKQIERRLTSVKEICTSVQFFK